MAEQQNKYAPPPRRRSNQSVKRELRHRIKGKPTHSGSIIGFTRLLGLSVSKALTLVLVIVMIAGLLLGGLGGGMLVGYITTAQPLYIDQIKNTNETTHIVDQNKEDVAILTGTQNINREYVAFAAVEHTYINEAFMAIEDERFEEHIGIDPKRIGSAILSALANGGSATHGGSTITQQTVKMVSGADQISAQRKIQEWFNAIELEKQKSKDEIMELYINLVPMGNSYVGIQSAAKAYFDKDAADLNLTECAFLAGVPNRPATYNPLTENGRRNALRRMRIVLSKMYELGMISESEYEQALDTEIIFRDTPQKVSSNQVNSYFVDYIIQTVISDLVEKRGYSEQMASLAVYNHGLTIETTLDQGVQEKVEEVFQTQEYFSRNPSALSHLPSGPQGSIVIVDNLNNPGQVKAMVGGYGEKTANFVLNRATSSLRQPGSSIKPLNVYGPALETGKVTAATIVSDQPVYYNNDEPTTPYPLNADKQYMGNITVRRAVEKSRNTTATHVLVDLIGFDTSLSFLNQVGIHSVEPFASAAMGALTTGLTTMEMAGAYSTFANNGFYTEPYMYTRVLDYDGNVLLENRPQFSEVYKPETAFVMTDILQGVLTTNGTASGYQLDNMPAAGKTGTTDDNIDKWFCGYTPYYTAAVWYGFDNEFGRRTKILSDDQNNAKIIWRAAMNSIHEGLEYRDFNKPETIVTATICKDSGMIAGPDCPNTATEYFIPGVMLNPSETCTLHLPVVEETEPEGTDVVTPPGAVVQQAQPAAGQPAVQ
ncbi:MAG: PBP1A family penicillin-binding protein [Eubacteriales bacterium]|nr:PBP1A family penicillin-binding protein [Eubacteriales bacterium]MDD3196808.1 PBP1A family penicillin-binding protein [Eubacteriales bacterium]MDD3503055.1 PBP1A family penicillin-binding protein [Eubacteriales bacterium]MDD4682534.1 PBP1A family penicillin-binding protein [Eubacteriales bacterium]